MHLGKNMQESEILSKFQIINRNLLITKVFGAVMLLPLTVLFLTRAESVIGITWSTAQLMLIIGMSVNVFYLSKYWKCPACGEKLGSGFKIEKCNHCGAKLK